MDMKNPGLYLHVPFCRGRCPYCNFFSTTRHEAVPRWLEALRREIALYREWDMRVAGPFDSLYIGGGTPSALPVEVLAQIMGAIRAAFPLADDAEITMEANPADLDEHTAASLVALGVNRVSLGAQSLDDRVLAFLGRRHDAAGVRGAVALLRRAGVKRLSLDLIYGVPGQSRESWEETLMEAAGLGPDHLSCYQLTLEDHTPLGRRRRRGEFALPGEEAQRELFLAASRLLAVGGYEHYEVSNYSRGPDNRSRHNMKYWRHAPYLGLGPSAHSFDGRRRWWNVSSLDDYCRRLESGSSAVSGSERLTREQLAMEAVSLGLRLGDGFSMETVLALDGSGTWRASMGETDEPGRKGQADEPGRSWQPERPGPLGKRGRQEPPGQPERIERLERAGRLTRLKCLEQAGLVRIAGERIRPTLDGLLVADSLALEICR